MSVLKNFDTSIFKIKKLSITLKAKAKKSKPMTPISLLPDSFYEISSIYYKSNSQLNK